MATSLPTEPSSKSEYIFYLIVFPKLKNTFKKVAILLSSSFFLLITYPRKMNITRPLCDEMFISGLFAEESVSMSPNKKAKRCDSI